MREVMWVVGLGFLGASLGMTACGGEAKFRPVPDVSESGAPANGLGGGHSQGGSTGSGADTSAARDAGGSAGDTLVSGGTAGEADGGDPEAGAAGSGAVDLEPLPYAGLGPCQFLPPIGAPTDNPNCPNAVFEGDITIETASDIERLSGCERVTGNLTVQSPSLTSLEGLEALRLVDGDLEIEIATREGRPDANFELKSLSGLDGLTCVAGSATFVDEKGLWRDVRALRNLIEVGGNASLDFRGPLLGLRRVFGLTGGGDSRATELPLLEVAIGGISRRVSAPRLRYAGDRNGCLYEGVLGCDWTVETQTALDAISEVMVVVRSLSVSGSVSSLAPLEKLHTAAWLHIAAAAVDSVEPLAALRRAPTLKLENLNVTTLDALDELEGVRDLRIVGTPRLRSLAGLGGARVRNLAIGDAPELESLADLSLSDDCVDVDITNAPKLSNVEALSAIRSVRGHLRLEGLGIENLGDISDIRIEQLRVANNAQLNYLGLAGADVGFAILESNPALHSPAGLATARFSSLRIEDNDAMTSLVGLPPLHDTVLELYGNDALTNLDGVKGNGTALNVVANASLQSLDGLELEDAVGLYIGDSPALTDVSALTGVAIGDVSIKGNLKLETLAAFTVARSLEIRDNAALTSVSGVELGASAGSVSLAGNAKLGTLDGFELTAADELVLEDNPTLAGVSALDGASVGNLRIINSPKLTALPAISVGPGQLAIRENAELIDIGALQSASGVDWAVVTGNPKLSSLTGLPRAHSLDVEDDASLVDLSGLEPQSVLEQLVIQNNAHLSSLRALGGVTSAEAVFISGNPLLPDCELTWFGARIGQTLPLGENGPTGACP